MSMNQCQNCGAVNKPQAKFCNTCGQPLRAPQPHPQMGICPQCGVPLRTGAKFCPACGYSTGILPPPGQILPQVPAQADPYAAGTKILGVQGGPPTLAVQYMGGVVEKHQITKPLYRIGRAPDNDLVINLPAVSGHHLQLQSEPGGYIVTDLDSLNGTQVNGRRIPPRSPNPLQFGDVIRIGDLTGNSVKINLESPMGESLRTLSLGSLDLSTQKDMLIGRDPSAYLPLNHPTVSYHHAMISKQNGSVVIRDLGSTNGTFVNGKRIAQEQLRSSDVVQIGPFKLVYNAQQQSLAQSINRGHRLDAIDLGREVKKRGGTLDFLKKRETLFILDDISVSVQPGDFVALVGGSGAGKSTLMKAMNGFEPANHGRMLIDGEPLYQRIDMYRTQMGYVPQDDIIHRELPVKLALWYAAKLRLPDATSAEIETRIQEALQSVDMVEHAEKPVKVLSGGQRKRVSIAVELLARPTLFFLDEPTSGLDPGLEKKMMYDLNKLSDEGRTIILVTHATANIDQCTYVSFLTWGKMAYFGPPNEAMTFFQANDFADIYMKLSEEYDTSKGKNPPNELETYYQRRVSGRNGSKVRSGDLWADHYRQSPQYSQYVTNRQTNLATGGQIGSTPIAGQPKRARDNLFRQTYILGRRMFDLIRHDFRTLAILVLMMPFIAGLFVMVSNERDIVDGLLVESGETYPEEVTDLSRDGESIYLMEKDPIVDELTAQLEGQPANAEEVHTPYQDAKMLLVMIALAMTQGGAFASAYEIVKEQAIFKRERAVNLKVSAYVLSKILVLALFALIQVALVVIILSLKIDLGFETQVLPQGYQEVFVTLYLAVLASICFGLFISAFVPNTDVVLYVILAQLFIQIILSGALFPLDAKAASYTMPGYWAMNSLGSQTNLPKLNELGTSCVVVEVPEIPGVSEATTSIECADANAPESEDVFIENLSWEKEHILITWGALAGHAVFWTALTVIVLVRKKIE